MMGAPMASPMGSAMPARGGMMPVARPKRPTMAARRAAMLGMKGMQRRYERRWRVQSYAQG
jgi:hypothetical protein